MRHAALSPLSLLLLLAAPAPAALAAPAAPELSLEEEALAAAAGLAEDDQCAGSGSGSKDDACAVAALQRRGVAAQSQEEGLPDKALQAAPEEPLELLERSTGGWFWSRRRRSAPAPDHERPHNERPPAHHGPPAPSPTTTEAPTTRPHPHNPLRTVDTHGHIQVKGNRFVSKKTGQVVQLRGMSLFESQKIPKYWNGRAIKWLRDDWHVGFVRAAMGIEDPGAYMERKKPQIKQVENVVKAAIKLGIYVVIDWHDHHAEKHWKDAKKFFGYMARKYGKYPHVFFEIYNEPLKQNWTQIIKRYHEHIVPAIREHTDNVIILGTRIWSQEVNVAAKDPVKGKNLAYTLHTYAATHKWGVRKLAIDALASGVPLFATEWGTCEASGNGALDLKEANTWLDFFKKNGIWDANWAVGDRLESCSSLWPGANKYGNWSRCDLTESGNFVRSSLRGERMPPLPPASQCPRPALKARENCSDIGAACIETKCCKDPSFTCFEKNPWFAGCLDRCKMGINPSDEGTKYATPWSCKVVPSSLRKRPQKPSKAHPAKPKKHRKPLPPPKLPPCVAKGSDCRKAACCSNSAEKCYEKNKYWAGCRKSCEAGQVNPTDPAGSQTPWTCRAYSRATDKENCRTSGICANQTKRCYEKNHYWAGCLTDCVPGLHDDDPADSRTPWSCRDLTHIKAHL